MVIKTPRTLASASVLATRLLAIHCRGATGCMERTTGALRRLKEDLDLVLGDACHERGVPLWTADNSTVFVEFEMFER
jgi:hypothetical protein